MIWPGWWGSCDEKEANKSLAFFLGILIIPWGILFGIAISPLCFFASIGITWGLYKLITSIK